MLNMVKIANARFISNQKGHKKSDSEGTAFYLL